MNKYVQLTNIVSVLLVLTACQQEGAPVPPNQPTPATMQAPTMAAVTSPLLSNEPASMSACDPASEATP